MDDNEAERVVVELNGQQRKILEILRVANYPDLTEVELLKLGFLEWAKLKRSGQA